MSATATGNLEATPMSQLLVFALDKRLTGSFVFQTHDGQRSALYVERGAPLKAKTAQPVAYLGRVLLEQGKIDEGTYNATLARVAKERALHGQILLEQGAVDAEAIEAALAEQLTRQIVWFFSLPSRTAYGFYDGQNYLERWGAEGAKVEPLSLFWRGVRRHENMKRIDATLARLGPRPVKLHASAQPGRFRFAPSDAPVVEVIRARPQLLRDLLGSGVADVPTVKRVVYALLISRHMDLGVEPLGIDAPPIGAPAPPAARAKPPLPPPAAPGAPPLRYPPGHGPVSSRSPLAAPPTSSPRAAAAPLPSSPTSSAIRPASAGPETEEVKAFREELERRLEALPKQNYYEILDANQRDDAAKISAAFFTLAKKWHPDRLKPEFAHLHDDVVKLFSSMNEANQTLSDQDRRKEYDEVVRDGGGTAEEQEQVQKVMRAVVAYQKAQVLFRKQNLEEAEKLAKQAMEDDPEQAEYTALWVMIEAQNPDRAASGNYKDLIELMNAAAKKEKDNEKVRYARGEVLKRSGDLDKAVKDFKWVAQNNPRNLDAIREVRLYEMRGGSPAKKAAAAQGGMLGKFFKR